MADMSDERPAKIPRVPTKMRSARRSGGAAAIVTELCAVTDEEPPTLSSAGASNASTLCETPGGARPAPEDAPPASDAAAGSARGGASPNGDGDAMPPPRPPARVGSLPHLNLHINIPSNPTTPLDCGKPTSARSSLPSSNVSQDTDEQIPPVTPATALSVLPLHAAVAAGDVDEVRRWLDVHAPVSKPSDAPNKASLSTPEWPPRPVRDILGPSSESREAPAPGAFQGRTADPLARPGSGLGARGVARSAPARDSDRSSAGDESRRGPVDARNEHGNTALAVAAALGDDGTATEVTTLLLDRGASPLALSNGWTPMHWAAQQGNAAAIAAMAAWEGGRAVDARAAETGDTPLMVAAASGRAECCVTLLDAGADALAVNADGAGVLSQVAAKVSRGTRSKVRAATREILLRAAPQLRVLLLHHEDCAGHVSVKPHQESPERIAAVLASLAKSAATGALSSDETLVSTDFAPAEIEHLARCHSEEYISVITELGERVANTPVAFTPYYQNHKGMPAAKQKRPEFSDTFFSPGTMAAALRAAGGVVHAVERVLTGRNRTAFVCVRPPGHHAGVEGATAGAPSSGFSILNNAMIGAMHALESNGGRLARRVAVIDFDVHHGNGTEEIARAWHAKRRKARARAAASGDEPDLMFCSIHLADDGQGSGIEFYPGTGVENDLHRNIVNVTVPPMWRGSGDGRGHASTGDGGGRKRVPKRNRDDELDGSGASLAAAKVAQAAAAAASSAGGREEWMARLRERVLPPIRAFRPDLLIISAGFDAANHDVGNAGVDRRGQRLPGVNLQPDDYEEMTARLCGVAASCGAKVVSVLEGGYGHLSGNPAEGAAGLVREGLAACVVGHVRALAGLVPLA